MHPSRADFLTAKRRWVEQLAWPALLACLCSPVHAMGADLAGYKTQIAPLLAKYCQDCHGEEDPEGGFSIESLDPQRLGDNQLETWRLVDEQLRFRDMPPVDSNQPTSNERTAILRWIRGEFLKTQQPGVVTAEKLLLPQFGNYVDHQALFGTRRSHVTPAAPRIWRLRPQIYHVIANGIHKGGRVDGLASGLNVLDGSEFKDYAASYFLDEAATAPLLANAKRIAAALIGPQSRNRFCKQLVQESASRETVYGAIRSVFQDALARAPRDEELQRFAHFHQQAFQAGGGKPAAVALISAILMQPEFFYRQELGDGPPDTYGRVRLAPREIAYALSYALSDRPRNEFFEAANKEELTTSGQVQSLLRSQLKDESLLQDRNPRMLQFFREYFHYPFAAEVFKDRPEGGEHDPSRLIADLETTLRDILRNDQSVLAELLTTRKFYVQTAYKSIKREGVKLVSTNTGRRSAYPTSYSLPLDWKWSLHLQPVAFRDDERAGVLTHPAWLAAWSGNFENHPVQRGKWIRTHLLGGAVPDVPIGVDARVPEQENTTYRDRLQLATAKAECWRCHRKMDPLGVAFERYDHYGRVQRRDAGRVVNAHAVIDRTGVPELDGKRVAGPTELMDVLAQSEHVEQVFVRHVFRFFLGRNETLGDANTLQDAHRSYRESGGSFRALTASLLSSDSFLYRQTGPRPEPGPE